MTPVFCCGFECGINTVHFTTAGTASFSTSSPRSGARCGRVTASASATTSYFGTSGFITGNIRVVRFYIYFSSLPLNNCMLYETPPTTQLGVAFKASDSKIYPASCNSGTYTFGSTGFTVTTGTWYLIDVLVNSTNNPHTVDARINGTSLTQLTIAVAAFACGNSFFGITDGNSQTLDMSYDDIVISHTLADYPIGAGYVNHFVPTADGTHNVAGANDFERSATGTDITNATTTAFQLVDDVPLKSGTPTEYINLIAPPSATDYVELIYGPAPGITTPTQPPRGVSVMAAVSLGTAGVANLRLALNDNGTTDDVYNGNPNSTTIVYASKFYSDPPSAATSWTLSGNGNFNNIRIRCLSNDAAPDPFFASTMIEAEFQEIPPYKSIQLKQAVNRSSRY